MSNVERRVLVKGIDNDTVIEYIENGYYRYANNINMGITDTGNAGILESTKGNTQVLTSNLAAIEAVWNTNFSQGTFKVIGSREDPTNRRVIYFVKNTPPTGVTQFDRILEYSYESNSIDVVLIYPFGFDENSLITGINVVDTQLLYWTDNWISPRKINIDKAKRYMLSAGSDPLGYPLVTNEVSEAIKYPPLFPPTLEVETDTTVDKNNIINKNFQFKYFYYKDDGEESCFSPISKISIQEGGEFINPDFAALPIYTKANNRIRVKINTGGYLDKKIGIAVRQGNTGDFFLVDTLDKTALGLSNFVTYDYLFYNDKILSAINLQKSIQLFDNVPRLAKAQEYIDGNRLVYGNTLEGYNNPKQLDVTITPTYQDISKINVSHTVIVGIGDVIAFPNYTPEVGDILYISGVTPFARALTASDVSNYPSSLVANLITDFGSSFPVLFNDLSVFGFPANAIGWGGGTIVSSYIYKGLEGSGTFKSGALHSFGLVYYDYGNRSGTTVRNTSFDVFAKFISQERPSAGDFIQQIGMDWSINHLPPDWATHYQWVYTGNTTISSFLQFVVSGCTYNQTNTVLNLTPLTNFNTLNSSNTILSYSFTAGDRVRILTDPSDISLPSYLDVLVINFSGNDLTIQNISNYPSTLISSGTLIEIYTPKPQTDANIYYEIGECYEIGNSGTPTAYHKGELSNQVVVNGVSVSSATGHLERGDAWIRPRRMDISTTTTPSYVVKFVEDYNVSDYYSSIYWDKGRPNRVSEDNLPLNGGSEYREIRRPTTIPWSDVYIPETNINGLSRFYDFNFAFVDQTFASVQKLYSYQRRLECYQELKVGAIPVQSKVALDASNNVVTYQTDTILNEIVYFDGDYGIATNPESFAANRGRRYFTDVNRGFVCRLSTDGVTPISQTYRIHSYITNLFRQITNGSSRVNIYGVFNKAFQRYEFALEQTGKIVSGQEIDPITIGFTDADSYKAWTSWFDYHPEGMCGAGQDFVSFKAGDIWVHNTNPLYCNFYGVQYSPEVWIPSNQNPETQKIYKAISMETNEKWNMPSIVNNKGQDSNLITTDFEDIENVKYAPFWKDTNTPNVVDPLINGDEIRDSILLMKFKNPSTGYIRLVAVNVKHIHSFLSP